MSLIAPAELAALEQAVERAFERGDHDDLEVLGYGEISSVVAWPTATGKVATKRLPPFRDRAAFDDYRAAVDDYLAALAAAGIEPVTTETVSIDKPGGAVVGYAVQPVLDGATLGPSLFRALPAARATQRFEELARLIAGCVSPRRGLDGQLSNWSLDGDRIRYLDLSTPMLRDEAGAERLDKDLFMSSLPWAIRPIVSRLMLREILDKYYEVRGVLVDFLGNLHKERLSELIPELLPIANQYVDRPIDEAEIARYYRGDARSWALLQRLRRVDRAWQRRIRRRPYPFLLPGRIDR